MKTIKMVKPTVTRSAVDAGAMSAVEYIKVLGKVEGVIEDRERVALRSLLMAELATELLKETKTLHPSTWLANLAGALGCKVALVQIQLAPEMRILHRHVSQEGRSHRERLQPDAHILDALAGRSVRSYTSQSAKSEGGLWEQFSEYFSDDLPHDTTTMDGVVHVIPLGGAQLTHAQWLLFAWNPDEPSDRESHWSILRVVAETAVLFYEYIDQQEIERSSHRRLYSVTAETLREMQRTMLRERDRCAQAQDLLEHIRRFHAKQCLIAVEALQNQHQLLLERVDDCLRRVPKGKKGIGRDQQRVLRIALKDLRDTALPVSFDAMKELIGTDYMAGGTTPSHQTHAQTAKFAIGNKARRK